MSDTQKNKPFASRLSDKIRLSLVLKLNLRMFAVLLSAFISINILLILLVSGNTLYTVEKGIQQLSETIEHTENQLQQNFFEVAGYQAIPVEDTLNGRRLPTFIQELLPVKAPDAIRRVNIPVRDEDMSATEQLQLTTYVVTMTIAEQPYLLSYLLGEDIYRLLILLAILLAAEFLVLLRSLLKGAISIRKTLRPISEMAETAKSLNAQVAFFGNTADGSGLQNLAGAISNIDVSHLDKRISVDDSQKELRDLAQAINLMLNRINASYQSQVRFVSDASHELRTPISVIQGYVNLLDRWGKNDEKTMQESIDAIKGETENMKTIVEQLLFLARGDNESMQLHLEVFDISDMVEEIVREAQMIDTAHDFQTQLQRPVPLYADRQLMKQAIRILLDNSIKYTPADETITLKVLQEGEQLKIVVQDNGIGIPPEDVPHIFDRFYRSDESRARKTGGSGLGLTIAKWIIERHKGHFEVLSRLDIGTRTTILLPVSTDKEEIKE